MAPSTNWQGKSFSVAIIPIVSTTTGFYGKLHILTGVLLGLWTLILNLYHFDIGFEEQALIFDFPAYCGVGFRTLTGLQGDQPTLDLQFEFYLETGHQSSVVLFNPIDPIDSPASCGVGFRTLTGLQGNLTKLNTYFESCLAIGILFFVDPTGNIESPAHCGVGFRTLTGLQGTHRTSTYVFEPRFAFQIGNSFFGLVDSTWHGTDDWTPVAFWLSLLQLSATHCGIGSVFPLPGLLLERLRTGRHQFNIDPFFWTQFSFLASVYLTFSDSRTTHCRVGSWFQLAGLLFDCVRKQGLGTLTDCPISLFHEFSFLRGWAPARWLALAGSFYLVTQLVLRFHIASFFWRLTLLIIWLILQFRPDHTLLLAKGALEWICDLRRQHTQHFSLTQDTAFATRGLTQQLRTDTACKSGPKSRPWFSRKYWHRFFLCLCFLLQRIYLLQTGRGEGSDLAMEVTEVHNLTPHNFGEGTKLHGMQPRACAGTQARPDTDQRSSQKVKKRSLQRAYRRALHQGLAWYKGSHYTVQELEKMGCSLPTDPVAPTDRKSFNSDLQRCNQLHAPKRRLTFWQWNCGGLSISKLDEVKAWLSLNQVDIAVMVETRWTYDATWTDSEWNLIHSGEGAHRGKGILILVSRRLCSSKQIQWQFHDSGRLVHLRLSQHPRNLDVIACYQHAFQPTKACLQARERWWGLLERVLAGLPTRNCLVMLGDFNSSLRASPRISGTSTFLWQGCSHWGTAHTDHPRLLQILRHFALVALNTWSSALGPTYVHGTTASRLDYICVRQMYADGTARRVRYLWDSPFISQTTHGHVPMLCTLAKYWIPDFASHRIQQVTMQQRQVSRQAYMTQSPAWMDFCDRSQAMLTEHFDRNQKDVDDFMNDLHNQMMQIFVTHFPAGMKESSTSTWKPALPLLLNKWQHRRLMQRPGLPTVHNIFKGWYHVSQFVRLKRSHQKFASQIRKQKFDEVVCSAARAAAQHDTHKLFQLINKFAPKQPRKQIQLRNHDGVMASPIESAALLNKYVADTWSGPQCLNLNFEQAPGVPFSVRQLETALALIPMTKAVAKPFSPGVVWRQHSAILAPLLYDKLCFWWSFNPPRIPSSWRHGWLFLIPKPSRPPVVPQNLRPLALQEPVGKAVIGLLIHLAMREASDHLTLFPVWAYAEHRSTLDAIRRVSLHCAAVRLLLSQQRSTPHTRANHAIQYHFLGGCQVCFDLKGAFDSIDRRKLFSRLHELHISPAIQNLLCAWHEATCYYVQHDHTDTAVDVGKGVRQGCKAAPGLWNGFVVLMLHDLMTQLPFEWIQRCITIYADDIHIGDSFVALNDFLFFQKALGIFVTTLASMDLILNTGKSIAILELRGQQGRAIRRQFVRHDNNGASLKITPLNAADIFIPIRKTAKYLGVLIGYGNFEDASLKHRLSLMHTGFRRLQRWLTGRHSLTIAQRYKLWITCIYPILSYGIFAMGLTQVGIQIATTQMMTMLRKLMHDHSYITRRTNAHVLKLYKFQSPARLLHGTAARLLRTLTERSAHLPSHDLVHTITWTHLPDLIFRLDILQATDSLETPESFGPEASATTPFYQCARCDFCTDNVSNFRRHCTMAHGHATFRTQFVKQSDFTTDGLPTCRFCTTQFSTWRMFQNHIERGCQELRVGPEECIDPQWEPGNQSTIMSTLQPQMAAARGLRMITADELHNLNLQEFGPRLLHIVHEREWDKVEQEREACNYLASRCIICSFQFSRCQELHQHFRLQHPDLWEHAPQKAVQLTNLYASESPCGCCGALFKTHSCPTWSQIAVLLVNGAALDVPEAAPIHEVRQRCELCLECFSTPADLVQHLQAQHGLQGLSYNESRDSLDGSSACSHCGQLFLTLAGLRSHIVQGRCQFFNPQATAETLPVDNMWKEACLDGKFLEILRPPAVRMRLTIVCQACGKGCQRASDLSLHLQSAHSRLWRQSQRLTMILVDVYYQYQCFCNPSTGVKRGNHICLPFRQLAMAFHRLDMEPFAPTVITDQALKDILAASLQHDLRYRLEQALVHRKFEDTWQDPGLLQLLRSTCLLCGELHPTADLTLHFREEHNCRHEMFLFYMEQLLPIVYALNLDDFQCRLCGLIYNLPAALRPDESLSDRAQLAHSHLKGSCPVLIQLAQLFGALLNGSSLRHGTTRHGGLCSDEGGIRGTGITVCGSNPGPSGESQADQSAQARRAKRPRCRDGRPSTNRRSAHASHEDADNHGSTVDQTRSRTSGPSKDGSIHSFFESRSDRGTPLAPPRDRPVEGESRQDGGLIHDSDDAAETAPDVSPADQHAKQVGQAHDEQGDRSDLHHLGRQGPDSCRPQLPLPPLGSQDPDVGSGQKDSSECQEDGSALGRAGGNDAGPGVGDALPRPESSRSQERSRSPLASPDQPPERQGLRLTLSSSSQFDMDGSWCNDEAAHLASNTHGNSSSEHAGPTQRPGEGQTEGAQEITDSQISVLSPELVANLTKCLCGLRLTNDRNWCYGNSIIHSLLWALVSLQDPMTDLWGAHFAELISFLQTFANKPATLQHTDWFRQIVKDWGAELGQKDCAECAQRTLAWLQSTAFDMRWERRLETVDGIQVHDQSCRFTPITLTLSQHDHDMGFCSLNSLVTAWVQEHATCAALLAPACACIHIDRYYRSEAGEIVKSLCRVDIESEVTLPIFRNSNLLCSNAGYIPIAAVAHFGQDLAGHCKAILKMQPTVLGQTTPAAWLITEDDCFPQAIWKYPTWYASNVVVIWMVRTDCLRLPMFCDPQTAPSTAQEPDLNMTIPEHDTPTASLENDFLRLLQAQPGARIEVAQQTPGDSGVFFS